MWVWHVFWQWISDCQAHVVSSTGGSYALHTNEWPNNASWNKPTQSRKIRHGLSSSIAVRAWCCALVVNDKVVPASDVIMMHCRQWAGSRAGCSLSSTLPLCWHEKCLLCKTTILEPRFGGRGARDQVHWTGFCWQHDQAEVPACSGSGACCQHGCGNLAAKAWGGCAFLLLACFCFVKSPYMWRCSIKGELHGKTLQPKPAVGAPSLFFACLLLHVIILSALSLPYNWEERFEPVLSVCQSESPFCVSRSWWQTERSDLAAEVWG